MSRQTLLVIGGGFSGLELAISLSGDLEVTLVDMKDYFEYTPGVLRAIMNPEHIHRITRSYETIANSHHFKFLQGEVESLRETSAIIRRGDIVQEVEFDFAVICCGSAYSEPIRPRKVFEDTVTERQVNLEEWREDIQQCKKILVLGGGTVGVELTGEILSHFPSKELTLATTAPQLLMEMPRAARRYAHVYFSFRGVALLYSTRMNDEELSRYDLIFTCTGTKPYTHFLRDRLPLDEHGRIIVNKFMQVEGSERIFAVGDCAITPINEPKTAYFAEETGKVAANNIRALAMHGRMRELPALEQFAKVYSVSLGPEFAITVANNLVLAGRLQSWLKDTLESMKMRSFDSCWASSMWKISHRSLYLVNKLIDYIGTHGFGESTASVANLCIFRQGKSLYPTHFSLRRAFGEPRIPRTSSFYSK